LESKLLLLKHTKGYDWFGTDAAVFLVAENGKEFIYMKMRLRHT
jgi:hypothetical protein